MRPSRILLVTSLSLAIQIFPIPSTCALIFLRFVSPKIGMLWQKAIHALFQENVDIGVPLLLAMRVGHRMPGNRMVRQDMGP